jgi:hypothetical protein
MQRVVLALVSILGSLSMLGAQVERPSEPPPDAFLLVQSELDYLARAGERLTIEFDEVAPAAALAQLAERVKLKTVIPEPLPAEPKLRASFRDSTLKEILVWFAEEVGVAYKVDDPQRLRVLLPPAAPDAD